MQCVPCMDKGYTCELTSLPAILHVGKKKKRKELKTRSLCSKECGFWLVVSRFFFDSELLFCNLRHWSEAWCATMLIVSTIGRCSIIYLWWITIVAYARSSFELTGIRQRDGKVCTNTLCEWILTRNQFVRRVGEEWFSSVLLLHYLHHRLLHRTATLFWYHFRRV